MGEKKMENEMQKVGKAFALICSPLKLLISLERCIIFSP